MALKFFNKTVRKSCSWCEFGTVSEYSNEVFCKKRGITEKNDVCRKYRYDPLKRTPDKIKIADNYKAEDFKL